VGKFPTAFRHVAVDRLKQWDNIVALAKELVTVGGCCTGAKTKGREPFV
jgi:hypothetical protein